MRCILILYNRHSSLLCLYTILCFRHLRLIRFFLKTLFYIFRYVLPNKLSDKEILYKQSRPECRMYIVQYIQYSVHLISQPLKDTEKILKKVLMWFFIVMIFKIGNYFFPSPPWIRDPYPPFSRVGSGKKDQIRNTDCQYVSLVIGRL